LENLRGGVLMLPVVAGRAETKRQILIYSIVLFPISLLPWALGFAGAIYGASATVSGATFIALALSLIRSSDADRTPAHRLFAFSILYLYCSRLSWPARRSDMRGFALAVLLIGAATLGGCSEGVLDPKGPIAAAERLIMLNSTGIMLAIVIPTILATLGIAFWFRASNTRARYMPDFAYSGRLELLVWSIPIMTVILVGGVTWIGSYDLDPPKPIASTEKPVRVQVVALDWKWLFIYPDHGIAAVNQLTIPVGTPIRFELTSAGVMNSFFVPQLGSQIYTMAGMVTRLYLQADHAGSYRGMSANYSGAGFSDMVFKVNAVPADKFAQWVTATHASGPTLDAQSYAELAKPSQAVTPFTYRAVAPDLFNGILSNVSSVVQSDDPLCLAALPSQRAEK
jgi:cytochrome o ubiquinol oxidase subunit 2